MNIQKSNKIKPKTYYCGKCNHEIKYINDIKNIIFIDCDYYHKHCISTFIKC